MSPQIAPAKQQTDGSEKNATRFLEQGGLAEAVMQGEKIHLRIENEPFIPLVMERHAQTSQPETAKEQNISQELERSEGIATKTPDPESEQISWIVD